MVSVVQTPSAVCCDCNDVLDTNSEPACEVYTGLDRKAHAWHEGLLFTFDHIRRLVSGYPDSVTGAMDELLTIAGVRDHTPGRAIRTTASPGSITRSPAS